jgi:D-sedoheptulose 7-phosphate isomerase
MHSWIQNYIAAQHRALDSLDTSALEKLITALRDVWRADRQVFAIGNGGSASNASHFATDLGKGSSDKLGKRFRVLSLTDNVSWITALGNDYAYEDVFVRQLENYARPGDLLISVSVSGSSPNLVKAAQWAKSHGVTTAGLVGGKRGKLAEICDHVLVVEDTHYGRAEDVQMHILHMLCYVFMEVPELSGQ